MRNKDKICWLPACERTVYAKDLCKSHYNVHLKGKLLDLLVPQVCECGEPVRKGRITCIKHTLCEQEGCDRQENSGGLCKPHYMTQWLAADPERKKRYDAMQRGYVRSFDLGPIKPMKEQPGYFQAHRRVKYAKGGPASEFPCVDCGKDARHWSLDDDTQEGLFFQNVRGALLAYSLDADHYVSRCVSCHSLHDGWNNKGRAENG